VEGSDFACIQGYAKAVVVATGYQPVWAFWHNDSGTWTVLWVGQENLPASSLGIPDDVYNRLARQVP
jgi:hypothetical protein